MNTTTAAQQRAAAKEFADFWKGKGSGSGSCVAELFRRYQALVNLKGTEKP